MDEPVVKKREKKATASSRSGVAAEAVKPKASTASSGTTIKRAAASSAGQPSTSSSASTSGTTMSTAKRLKLDFASSTTTTSKASTQSPSASLRPALEETHLTFCANTEIEFADFPEKLYEAVEQAKFNKVARLICAALREFDKHNVAAGTVSYEESAVAAISLTIRDHAEKITNQYLVRALLCALANSRGLHADKQASNSGVYNSLLVSWLSSLVEQQAAVDPVLFHGFLHDMFGDRAWIDKPCATPLFSRLLRIIGTNFPDRSMYLAAGGEMIVPEHYPDQSAKPITFTQQEDFIKLTLEIIRRWWEHSGENPQRAFLRALMMCSALPEVRVQIARRIDNWLQSPKHQRPALEMLLFLGCNLTEADSEAGKETLGALLRLRSYKSKAVGPVFSVMLREMMTRSRGMHVHIVRALLTNELGSPQSRYPMNMHALHAMLVIDNRETSKVIGGEIALLLIREDTIKIVRTFVRELARSYLRGDFLFSVFADSLLDTIGEMARNDEVPEGMPRAVVDACVSLPLVAITAQVRDALIARRNGAPSSSVPDHASKYQTELQAYFEAVFRGLTKHSAIFSSAEEMIRCINRALFLDSSEHYGSLDVSITAGTALAVDNEWIFGARLIEGCPLTERMLEMVAETEMLESSDRIYLLGQLIQKAMSSRFPSDASLPLVELSSMKLFDVLFATTEHSFAEIGVPIPVSLAIEELAWKIWLLVTYILVGSAPSALFDEAYRKYPTLRMLVRMVLTGRYEFPIALDGISKADMAKTARDQKEREREIFRSFEHILARKEKEDMAEDDYQLWTRLVEYCPTGPPRPPPRETLEELRHFAHTKPVAAQLCEIRSPDLLSELIAEHGAAHAMPAIEELLKSNPSAVSFVPLSCLCQFLLHHLATDPDRRTVDAGTIGDMALRLRSTIASSAESEQKTRDASDTVLLLFDRLAFGEQPERDGAAAMLSFIFTNDSAHTLLSSCGKGGRRSTTFNLEAFAKSPLFEDLRSRACRQLAEAIPTDGGDVRRRVEYVRFVAEHAKNEEIHEMAHLISCHPIGGKASSAASSQTAIDKETEPLLVALIDFYAKYMQIAQSGGSVGSGPEGVAMLKLQRGEQNKEFPVVASALFSSLELLSLTEGGGESRDRLLAMLLNTKGGLPCVCDSSGSPVQLMNDKLQALMLSSADEKIVQIALKSVEAVDSLRLIRTFGLTSFSATKLLEALDQLSSEQIKGDSESSSSRSFVIAYKSRGAIGGEMFLEKLSTPTSYDASKVVKDEPMEEDQIVWDPPPVPSTMMPIALEVARAEEEKMDTEPVNLPIMTKVELVRKLKSMVAAGASFNIGSEETRAAAASEQSTDACLEFLEGNLKFFFAQPSAFTAMTQLVVKAAEKYPSASSKLSSLCNKILKATAVPATIESTIRQLASPSSIGGGAGGATTGTTSGGGGSSLPLSSSKKGSPDNLRTATADSILYSLYTQKAISAVGRTRLVNRFFLLRPEVIDVSLPAAEVDSQIKKIFGAQPRNGLDRLVAQLWLRASPETIGAVLRHVLAKFDEPEHLSTGAVLELLSDCIERPSFYRALSQTELQTACAYMVAHVVEQSSANDEDAKSKGKKGGEDPFLQMGDIVEKIVDILGNSFLRTLSDQCIRVENSPLAEKRRMGAARLKKELMKRFPFLSISPYSTRIAILGQQYKLPTADKIVGQLVNTLFECDVDSDVANAVDSLTVILEKHPEIIVRQLPVMSRLMTKIVESTTKQIRETRRYRWVVNFIITAVTHILSLSSISDLETGSTVLPLRDTEDMEKSPLEPATFVVGIADVNRLIDELITFLQTHVAKTLDERDLAGRILGLISAYAKGRLPQARAYLARRNGPALSAMVDLVNKRVGSDEAEKFNEIKHMIEARM